MILKYKLKKVFSKKLNRIVLIAALLAAVALSVFAIGSACYVDENGEGHTGLTASRRLAADKNRWAGELTGDKIAQVVSSRTEINRKSGTCQARILACKGKRTVRKAVGNAGKGLRRKRMPTL